MILPPYKKQLLLALKKTHGTLRRIEKMIEDEQYCLDIAQQTNAALGLLRQANSTILKNHLKTCGRKKMLSTDESIRDEFIAELVRTFGIISRK